MFSWARWLSTNSIGLIAIKLTAGNWSLRLLAATDFSTERSSTWQPSLNQNTRSPRTTAGLGHNEIYLELTIFWLFWLHKSLKATERLHKSQKATKTRTERVVCRLSAQTEHSERIFFTAQSSSSGGNHKIRFSSGVCLSSSLFTKQNLLLTKQNLSETYNFTSVSNSRETNDAKFIQTKGETCKCGLWSLQQRETIAH